MKVYFTQVYAEAGVNFPFSLRMQSFLGNEVSAVAKPTDGFVGKYGDEFSFGINISARRGLFCNEIKGPTVFKRDKNVEYTLYLPYDCIVKGSGSCRVAVELILSGVSDILRLAAVDAVGFDAKKGDIVERLCSDVTMINRPWPTT